MVALEILGRHTMSRQTFNIQVRWPAGATQKQWVPMSMAYLDLFMFRADDIYQFVAWQFVVFIIAAWRWAAIISGQFKAIVAFRLRLGLACRVYKILITDLYGFVGHGYIT